jgi:hypothetical protein
VAPTTWKKWVGIGLIGLSGVWFALMLTVPFLPFSLGVKALLGTLFFVLMEASFWLGTVIVGKQAISKWWGSVKARRRKTEEGKKDG